MNRKEFLSAGFLLGSAALMGRHFLLSEDVLPHQLVLFHTNDMHSRVLPFPSDHPKNPSKGGMLAIAGKLRSLRELHPFSLVLDCGDFLQGTPFFNEYGGEVEVDLMNKMGYDYVTLGNHEFDNGEVALANLLANARFKVVCCNYDLSNSPLQNVVATAPQVHTLTIGERQVKVGILGLGVNLEGLAHPGNRKGVVYLEPAPILEKLSKKLKQEEGCDRVVVLSHLGIEHDKQLARDSEFVDVILGGHSHTYLEAPLVLNNRKGLPVIVNQVYRDALFLGQIFLPVL